MLPPVHTTPTESRLAGACVDASLAAVRTAAASVVSLERSEFDTALHRSISVLLKRELHALTCHDPNSRVLPRALNAWAAQWKAELERSVLEARLEQRASQWRNSLLELLDRFACDRTALADMFGLSTDARLIRISAPLSDPHNYGRAVYKIDFGDGTALIYKPRSVDGEYTFGRLVKWIRDSGFELPLEMCLVLPRDRYGWTSFIAEQFADGVEDALSYHECQGAFLALFFLVGGSDCISDNLIVKNDRPVWIDTECVCSPRLPRNELKVWLPDWMFETVLSTLMVFWANEMGEHPRRNTGLAVSCTLDRSVVFAESDVMREPFIRAVLSGFRRFYEWVLERHGIWASPEGPLSWWEQQRIRAIPRATALYAGLIDLLRVAPVDSRARAREAVEGFLRAQGRKSWGDDFIEAEMKAIQRADVPYWTTSTDSCELVEAGGDVAKGLIQQSGIVRLKHRTSQMSGAHLNTQLWLIESYLRVRVFH